MPAKTIRHIGTTNGTSTFKVADDKIEGGEAVVIVVERDNEETMVQCLTCSAYKCEHARRALLRVKEGK